MKKLFCMILATIPASLFGGAIDSGGGRAVVCSEGEEINEVYLLDLYEGSVAFGDVHLTFNEVDDYLAVVNERVAKSGFRYTWNLETHPSRAIPMVKNRIRFLESGSTLKLLDDSFEGILPSEDCEIRQIARFYDKNNLVVDGSLFEKMSNRDQAALYVHEAIYWADRENSGVSDSRRVRRVVSSLFMDEWVFGDSHESLPTSHVVCSSTAGHPLTIFTSYRKGDWKVINFQYIGGEAVLGSKVLGLWGTFPLLDSELGGIGQGGAYQAYAKFESDDEMYFYRSGQPGSLISLNVERTAYPARDFSPTEMWCSERNLKHERRGEIR